MMLSRITLFLFILLISGVACLEYPTFAGSPGENTTSIAVIVNGENPVTALTHGELQAILLGERQSWSSKEPIVLMMRTYGSPEREIVVQKICRMNAAEYHQYWSTKIFRGEASVEPVTLPSVGTALNFVANVKGGISFVAAGGINAKFNVKILRIDGRLPGEPGYPLQ
jgi:ABC-type phosphate transport system substrate-binding protein